MDLTPEKFQFSIVNISSKKSVHFSEIDVLDFSKNGLTEVLNQPIFSGNFASYSLSSGSNRNTLIPVSLFAHNKSTEIFKLNFSEPHENLDYSRLAELGIVNIYEFPLWIKSLFVAAFPRIKLLHRSTVLLKGAFDHIAYSPKLQIHIDQNQFYFLITRRSELVYFNRFDYKSLSDIVYYVLYVLEQKEIEQEKIELHLSGVNTSWAELKTFQDFFKTTIRIHEQNELSKDYMLTKQLLCV
jgi:hypothetical protein